MGASKSKHALSENIYVPVWQIGCRTLEAHVNNVIDGDTINVIALMPYWDDERVTSPGACSCCSTGDNITKPSVTLRPCQFRVRMHGYDSAELHPSKTLIDRDAHMRIAQAAKRKLKELIEGKIVR